MMHIRVVNGYRRACQQAQPLRVCCLQQTLHFLLQAQMLHFLLQALHFLLHRHVLLFTSGELGVCGGLRFACGGGDTQQIILQSLCLPRNHGVMIVPGRLEVARDLLYLQQQPLKLSVLL